EGRFAVSVPRGLDRLVVVHAVAQQKKVAGAGRGRVSHRTHPRFSRGVAPHRKDAFRGLPRLEFAASFLFVDCHYLILPNSLARTLTACSTSLSVAMYGGRNRNTVS